MKLSRIVSSVGITALLTAIVLPTWILPSFAQVNSEYLPNYGISQSWERIMDNFIQIQGIKKVGDIVPTTIFLGLYKDFQILFPQLPQRNNYKIIYNVCVRQAQKLSAENNNGVEFDTYMDQCQ